VFVVGDAGELGSSMMKRKSGCCLEVASCRVRDCNLQETMDEQVLVHEMVRDSHSAQVGMVQANQRLKLRLAPSRPGRVSSRGGTCMAWPDCFRRFGFWRGTM
jgi:hypothetical protein